MKIALLLSGGVDSSTALRRLIAEGFTDITAYYLKIWLEDDTAYMGECPWEEDIAFAQAVCDAAGVQLEIVPLQLEYYDKVVTYALAELRAGRTPSPDIFCNQHVKFGAFLDHAAQDCTKVASGHYARIDWVANRIPQLGGEGLPPTHPDAGKGVGHWRLLRAPDPVKDQTYFLSHLSPTQLGRVLFPIGDLEKHQVRELAHQYNLANQDRPDSQGICFLGKIRYPDFVRHYLGEEDGPIVELETGLELGRHNGFWFHTVGQRTGLKLGNGPWYVAAKDCRHNIVFASHASHNAERERRVFEVAELTWLSGYIPGNDDLKGWTGHLQLKLRHGPQLIDCHLEWVEACGPGQKGSFGAAPAEWRLRVIMEQPDRGLAAGQFAVFYLGQECLGSGKIQELDLNELDRLLTRYQERKAIEATKLAEVERRRREKIISRRKKYFHPQSANGGTS